MNPKGTVENETLKCHLFKALVLELIIPIEIRSVSCRWEELGRKSSDLILVSQTSLRSLFLVINSGYNIVKTITKLSVCVV